eukprot:SAG22_NODE_157_length_16986_cov_17.230177_7_plen_703_part_00
MPGISKLAFAWIQKPGTDFETIIIELTVDSVAASFGSATGADWLEGGVLSQVGGSLSWKKTVGDENLAALLDVELRADHPTWEHLPDGVASTVDATVPIPAECYSMPIFGTEKRIADPICTTLKRFGTQNINTKMDYSSHAQYLEVMVQPDVCSMGVCFPSLGNAMKDFSLDSVLDGSTAQSLSPLCGPNDGKFTLAEIDPQSMVFEWNTTTHGMKVTALAEVSLVMGLIPMPDLILIINYDASNPGKLPDFDFGTYEDLPKMQKDTYAISSDTWGEWVPGLGVNFQKPQVTGSIRLDPFGIDISAASKWCFGSKAECMLGDSIHTVEGETTISLQAGGRKGSLGDSDNKALQTLSRMQGLTFALSLHELTLARLTYAALYGLLPDASETMVGLMGPAAQMAVKDVFGSIELPPLSADTDYTDLLEGMKLTLAGTVVPPECPLMDESVSIPAKFVACLMALAVPSVTGSIVVYPGYLKVAVGTARKQISPPFGFNNIPMGRLGTWEPPEMWLSTDAGNGMAVFVDVKYPPEVVNPSLAIGIECGLNFCGQSSCTDDQFIKFKGAGKLGIDATSTAAVGVELEMENWWWNLGFAGLTRGLTIQAPSFKFLHFGNAVLEADIGLNIAAAIASGGTGALAPIVKIVKIGGSGCVGSACDCAALAGAVLEGCGGHVLDQDSAVLGAAYLSFSVDDPSTIAFTAKMS